MPLNGRAFRIVRIWEESFVPVFLERFILPVLATSLIGVILLNPFRFDWQQQAALAIAVVAIAYFVGYTVHKRNEAQAGASSQTEKRVTPLPQSPVEQRSFGPGSPNIIGDHNTVTRGVENEERHGKKPR